MYTGNKLDNYIGQRKIDIDVAGKTTKLSNFTSLLSFLQAHHIELHLFTLFLNKVIPMQLPI